jgi:RNA polymerase sigma-70 factor, ECF subfamily
MRLLSLESTLHQVPPIDLSRVPSVLDRARFRSILGHDIPFSGTPGRRDRKVSPPAATNRGVGRSSDLMDPEAAVDETRVVGDFLPLLNQFRGVIERVSRAYTWSAAEREDLVQDIVYQLWRAFPSYRGDATPITWTYRIALNTAITGLRRQSRRPAHLPLEAAADVAAPSASAGADSRTELLYRAIRRLGDVDRALVMCYLDDLSYRDIADVLGLSETNVGARLSRVRVKLQQLVGSME